jgi:hypothetical protein
MTLLPRGVKVHLAFGFIEMRKGIDGRAGHARSQLDGCAKMLHYRQWHSQNLSLA